MCGAGTLAGKKKLHLNKDYTLLETLEREEKYRENEFRSPTYEQIDVFDRSRYAWQKRAEHYMLQLPDSQALFCQSVEDGYIPVLVSQYETVHLSEDVLPLDYCMGVCEDYARQSGVNSYTLKDTAWRNQMPTEKQIRSLIAMGIQFRPSITRGEASELLSQAWDIGATDRQIYTIKKYRLHEAPELLTKKQAREIISVYYAGK